MSTQVETETITPIVQEPQVRKNPNNSIPYATYTRKYFPVLQQLQEVQEFRTLKEDILTAGQIAVLKTALSEKKLEKASFYQLIQGFEILNKIERLETNKSTSNIAINLGNIGVEELLNKK